MEDKYIGKELEQKCGDILIVQKRIKSNGSTVTAKAYQRGTAYAVHRNKAFGRSCRGNAGGPG